MRYYYFGKAIGNQSTVRNHNREERILRATNLRLERRISDNHANDHRQETQGKNLSSPSCTTLTKWRQKRRTYSSSNVIFQLRPKFPVGPKRLIRQKLKNGRKI